MPFSTDFSDNAEPAFIYVDKIADSGAKKVTLLHVHDQSKIDRHLKEKLKEFNQTDTQRLQRLKFDLEERGVKDVRIEIHYGSPQKRGHCPQRGKMMYHWWLWEASLSEGVRLELGAKIEFIALHPRFCEENAERLMVHSLSDDIAFITPACA